MTRDQILQKLLDDKLIKLGTAIDVKASIPVDADESTVLSLLKGELRDVSPRALVESLGIQMSAWNEVPSFNFNSWELDKALAGDERRPEGESIYGQDFSFTGEEVTPYNLPINREVFGYPDTRDYWDNTGFEDSIEAVEYIQAEYARLALEGVFSTEETARLDRLFLRLDNDWRLASDKKNKEALNEISREMLKGSATIEDLSGIRTMLPESYDFTIDEDEQAFLDRAQPEYQGLRSLSPDQQEAAGYGVDAVVDSSTEDFGGSFLQRLTADGIIGPDDLDIQTRERLDFTGAGTVLDRATGQVMSHDEWNLIKTNEEARAAYQAMTTTSDVVQRLLASGKFTQSSQYWDRDTPQYRNLMPIEDLAIPTLAPDMTQPWQAGTYDYKTGDGRAEWLGFSVRERAMRLKLMADNGIFSEGELEAMGYQNGMGGSALNFTAMNMWEQAVSVSSEFQYSPLDAIRAIGEAKAVAEAPTSGRGSGRIAPTYSVPASLREIPDYKTLAQNTKSIFRGELGREMEDWEVALYADELGRQHTTANERRIAIHKEAWDDAVSGGSTEVDFTAVEDPNLSLQYDIEETYANEIGRNVRVEDKANQHRLLMSSISLGRRMV